MRDRQHYQFSLGGDKHLWWCRVGMGFKHERCNGDIQGVELDEKIVVRWLGEWIDWSWKRGWFGGVESWQLCKDTVWTSLWCHCFYLKFLTTTKTSFCWHWCDSGWREGCYWDQRMYPFKGHFAMVLLEMQPDGDGSSSVMFTAHIGDVGVGWKCSWASSSETVETVRYSDS